MPLQELKQIIANQKTVSTARLAPIVRQLNKIYIQQGQKINAQRKALKRANTRLQREKTKAEKRKHLAEENQELRAKIGRQKRELAVLTGKLSKRW